MENVLTVMDVSERLRVSLPTAYRIVNSSDFPVIRVGRAIRIPEAAFVRWLEKQVEDRT